MGWRGYALRCLAVGWWPEVGCWSGSREGAGGSAGVVRGQALGVISGLEPCYCLLGMLRVL